MRRETLRRLAAGLAILWLLMILSAELLHAQIEDESLAARRQCPVCLFHKTHGHVPQPELVLQPVLKVILAEVPPLPALLPVFPRLCEAFHQDPRAPPACA
ncbi:MAG: hypothetical protein N2045_09175 [Fimbriimonadales bacterium]|nr:hypothetical protein [Armatimonadota bacterium]MCX7688127.1 hypothetical protein [Fimbriimonadales bacterium]GBC90153.1 hypothetical protein HRbin14_00885 [bacterium HR14]GIV13580.1 MAG: hypothetical protein KatS3mg021_1862 [Fimbriimonadales bacterium]